MATYRSARELRELIDRLLADPAERRRRAERGRAIVLAAHTFSHRVDELLSLVSARARESRLARKAAKA